MSSRKKELTVYLGEDLKKKAKVKAALEDVSISAKFREFASEWTEEIELPGDQ